jgi:hypothetical protein
MLGKIYAIMVTVILLFPLVGRGSDGRGGPLGAGEGRRALEFRR